MLLWHSGNDTVQCSVTAECSTMASARDSGICQNKCCSGSNSLSTPSLPLFPLTLLLAFLPIFLFCFLLSFSPSSFSLSFWRTAHTIVYHHIILLAIRKLWKPRKTETLWQNSSEQWLQGHSALGSTSTASGRRDPELGWQEDKEAQKNIRKRWRKMHCFLEWDGQCNPACICLEFYVAPWSIFKSLMYFLRTSGINWTADFQKGLSFESSRVKSFCIINSLSHLPFFLSLFSSSFSSGEDWSSHKVVRVNLTLICRH